jgi:hypothetical protein
MPFPQPFEFPVALMPLPGGNPFRYWRAGAAIQRQRPAVGDRRAGDREVFQAGAIEFLKAQRQLQRADRVLEMQMRVPVRPIRRGDDDFIFAKISGRTFFGPGDEDGAPKLTITR